jgi:DNA-binding IclR family transcriptional regulator
MTDENRSLLRGIQILKAFRPGSDLLGNGELAERTGLSRSTVSRLTQTLVVTGILEHDAKARAYRLAAPVLSFAFAMRSGSPILKVVAPIMREVSQDLKVNVGIAVADELEMIYLESIRYTRRVAYRNVVAGLRIPIELTSMGRAWLSTLSPAGREGVLKNLMKKRQGNWKLLSKEIKDSIDHLRRYGYCHASWQPGVLAVSTPIRFEGFAQCYVINLSVSDEYTTNASINTLGAQLLSVKQRLIHGVSEYL